MDFSGASLNITVNGEGKAIGALKNIDQQAQEMMRKISSAINQAISDALRIDRVAAPIRLVRQETEALNESVLGLSRSSVIGFGELARGIAKTAQAGEVGMFAMREFTGAAFRLTEFLGPAGELLPVVGLLGYALHEVFAGAQKDVDDMKKQFSESLTDMVNEGKVAELKKKAQDIWMGTPAKDFKDGLRLFDQEYQQFQRRLAESGGITHAAIAKQFKDFKKSTGIDVDEMERQFGALRKAILDVRNMPLNFPGLDPTRVDANAPGTTPTVPELDGLRQRAAALRELQPHLVNEQNEVVALRLEELTLRMELDRGNISIEQRIAKTKELARVTTELEETSGSNIFMGGQNVRVNVKPADKSAADSYDKDQVDAIKRSGTKMQQEAQRISDNIGRTLASGITTGIKAAFSPGGNIGTAFKAMTDAILSGLGEMFARVAEKALIGSQLMKGIVAAIRDMNPWIAAAAAIALLAFGNSLRGSGSSGGGAGGYGGGGYSGGGGSVIDRGIINPMAPTVTNPSSIVAKQSQTLNFFVVGPRDPHAQRLIQETVRNANARGNA